eukprot:NODE_6028_length_581_cov_124.931718_g5863_i0.p2 GENE.NODE_6028_length_581_cov_124.931718_g5863_i0~~NODE_6028_length_581_cov_124.931718_g5863_i0.p2  ORF type:complete len:146 (+),score=31.68 NODE_6028_length_581_cov_124.931718_g5863_i0:54-491(+)
MMDRSTNALRFARSYFVRSQTFCHAPLKRYQKYTIRICGTGFLAFYCFLALVDRNDQAVIPTNREDIYLKQTWIDYWLTMRNLKRKEMAAWAAIETKSPEEAAEVVMDYARLKQYRQLMEEYKLLEPALDEETKAKFAVVPEWAA